MMHRFSNAGTKGMLQLMVGDPFFMQLPFGKDRGNRFYTIAWNRGEAQVATIDSRNVPFPAQAWMPLMSSETFHFQHPQTVVAWQFNRDFYCIVNHDKQVGCAGFLFYGHRGVPVLRPDPERSRSLQLLFELFVDEFGQKDSIQEEMLRVLLVRLIITLTRLAREQDPRAATIDEGQWGIIRRFNLEVEIHFREKHDVAFYAGKLHRSPKTLTNLFAQYGEKSPLQIIHDRIVMEAKRWLTNSDLSIKEIAQRLGFDDAAYFSRFFKKNTGTSCTSFRSRPGEG